ncbi:hypothetical protein V1512DRAFT_272437 [Lipomyces arxii]|uniref:uncharacterized protein n=1 Tax=Lipomyces arxii TaxID=56418 RepID=UPI0034CD1B5B
MSTIESKAVIFKAIPTGQPTTETIVVEKTAVEFAAPEGGLLVQVLYVSLDPYLRGKMRDPSIKSYTPAYNIGETLSNFGVCRVVDSGVEAYKKGDLIRSPIVPFSEYAAVSKTALPYYQKIDNVHNFPLTYFIGILGMPGLTAFYSFYEIGQPKKGETIYISAAAGAVGMTVGQLAKAEGLRVVGSAGSDDKVKFLKEELGFDEAWNYKKEPLNEAMSKYMPEGIDIYFENVGGEMLDAVLAHANTYGRIIACGMISQYSLTPEKAYGVKNLMSVVAKRLKIQGFVILDQLQNDPNLAKTFYEKVSDLLASKKMTFKDDVYDGIEETPEAFIGLLTGKNFGKVSVKFAE